MSHSNKPFKKSHKIFLLNMYVICCILLAMILVCSWSFFFNPVLDFLLSNVASFMLLLNFICWFQTKPPVYSDHSLFCHLKVLFHRWNAFTYCCEASLTWVSLHFKGFFIEILDEVQVWSHYTVNCLPVCHNSVSSTCTSPLCMWEIGWRGRA